MIKSRSARYVLAFVTSIGISTFLFHIIGGFPIALAILIALILWAVVDALHSV